MTRVNGFSAKTELNIRKPCLQLIADGVKTVKPARPCRQQAERDTVRILLDQGWSTRDAGKALGLSHQRVSQLAPRGTA